MKDYLYDQVVANRNKVECAECAETDEVDESVGLCSTCWAKGFEPSESLLKIRGEWFDVLQQTPGIGEEVLVCFLNPDTGEWVFDVGSYHGEQTAGMCIAIECGDDDDFMPCSHWRHLPKPPHKPSDAKSGGEKSE